MKGFVFVFMTANANGGDLSQSFKVIVLNIDRVAVW
jgi:hypothetical protein